ncbi:type II toxin-antitoxin system VapC family toxin [Candidatus Poriferisodalis sp.]|uniref:type II toxin-antitoxin system VapC family toxin n=1 Tax=Candidatus Poriferisodalis sp. TaxID=3101277 RepID=UPI003B01176C
MVSASRAETLLRDLEAVPIRRVPHRRLVVTAWKHRHNVSAYDALYVALAELLDAPLLTADGRLMRSPNLGITVHHVQLT